MLHLDLNPAQSNQAPAAHKHSNNNKAPQCGALLLRDGSQCIICGWPSNMCSNCASHGSARQRIWCTAQDALHDHGFSLARAAIHAPGTCSATLRWHRTGLHSAPRHPSHAPGQLPASLAAAVSRWLCSPIKGGHGSSLLQRNAAAPNRTLRPTLATRPADFISPLGHRLNCAVPRAVWHLVVAGVRQVDGGYSRTIPVVHQFPASSRSSAVFRPSSRMRWPGHRIAFE